MLASRSVQARSIVSVRGHEESAQDQKVDQHALQCIRPLTNPGTASFCKEQIHSTSHHEYAIIRRSKRLRRASCLLETPPYHLLWLFIDATERAMLQLLWRLYSLFGWKKTRGNTSMGAQTMRVAPGAQSFLAGVLKTLLSPSPFPTQMLTSFSTVKFRMEFL